MKFILFSIPHFFQFVTHVMTCLWVLLVFCWLRKTCTAVVNIMLSRRRIGAVDSGTCSFPGVKDLVLGLTWFCHRPPSVSDKYYRIVCSKSWLFCSESSNQRPSPSLIQAISTCYISWLFWLKPKPWPCHSAATGCWKAIWIEKGTQYLLPFQPWF